MNIKEEIKELEKEAIKLEPTKEQRVMLREKVVRYTEDFIDTIDNFNINPTYSLSASKGLGIMDNPIGSPYDFDDLISLVKKNVDTEGLNPASGGHLGYIPGGGVYTSSLADYWADITNRYAGVFFANPGAVRMENHLINWMKEIIRYPKEALGNLASGGSISNLIAIVTAREAKRLQPKDYDNAVIYLSPQAHHCINKALNIAGLHNATWRLLSQDENHRIDPKGLKETIQEDKRKGLIPLMVIASAGTTNTGALDPLDELADIAQAENLWFHIDAAYGGFFVLLDEFKDKLKGMGRADSVVMDPHKGLFLPYGTGVVLIKNGDLLKQTFHYTASYLQDTQQHVDEISPADISPELTKHFRGLRMWLPLMYHGLEPFKAALQEKILLARYFYEEIQKIDGIEVGPYPDMSVVTFRYNPKKGNPNQFNQEIVRLIHEDGRLFISSTNINEKFILRLAVLSFRTRLETVDLMIEILKEKIDKIKNAPLVAGQQTKQTI